MSSYAGRRFVFPAVGLGEAFFTAPAGAPATREAFAALGFNDGRMDYVATRSAPMGAVSAEVAISAFYGFHPGMTRRYIPAAWELATPEQILEVHRATADAELRRLLGDWVDSADARETAALARAAAEQCDYVGRSLFAGLASLSWPDEAHMVAWHAFTMLREFRGDTHNAMLVAHRVDGCECNQLMVAATVAGCECHQMFSTLGSMGSGMAEVSRVTREWPVDEWEAATQRLQDRGILRDDGSISAGGMELHVEIERLTDEATATSRDTDLDDVERLAELMKAPFALLRQDWRLPI
jgi:hypothetical protein